MTKQIGDRSRDGLLEITDTNWDSNGTLRVTLRELVGEQGYFDQPKHAAAARRLARSAIGHPEVTRSSRVVRRWWDEGSEHITFAVSRLDPR